MCPHCRAFITTNDRTCPYCHETVGARAIDVRAPGDLLGGLIPHVRYATTMLLVINFGKRLAEGLPAAVMDDPEVRRVYLGLEA